MDVSFVGTSPVRAPVLDGLRTLGLDPNETDIEAVEATSFVIVAGTSEEDLLDRASLHLDRPWIGIELGGMGGLEIEGILGSIAVFAGDRGPCHRCLHTRLKAVDATLEAGAVDVDQTTASYAGVRAARLLGHLDADGIDPYLGTVDEIDGGRRQLLPVPGCTCAGQTDRHTLTLSSDGYDLDEALDRAEMTIDERLGIVAEVGEQASFPTPYYLARLADTSGFSDRKAAELAAGVDHDWNGSFMRALGEALERYCAGIYRLKALSSEPTGQPVELDRLALTRDEDTPLGPWWPGVDLEDQSPVSLPAEAVVFPPPSEADLAGITTGLGFGSSSVAAILRGLLEVVERDACMLAWYSTFDPIGLRVETEGYRTIERRIASEGLGATSLLVTQDIDIPVVTAVVHRRDVEGDPMVSVPGTDNGDWPAFAVGSAAAFDPSHAAERALAEATQNWMELRSMGPVRAKSEGAIARFATFPRKARGLITMEHVVPADSVGPDETPQGENALERAIEAVTAVGLDVYASRLTTPDIEQLGFEAARVIVPEAQPLVRETTPMTERLREVPPTLGFRPRLDRGPHPYP